MARKKREAEVESVEAPAELSIAPPPVTEADTSFITEEPKGESDPETPTVTASAESVRGTLSQSGEEYDPAIHVYPPTQTKLGHWRKRKGTTVRGSEVPPDELPNANYRREAEKIASLYATFHTLIFGKAGGIESREDLVPMTEAWESYMQANGLKQVDPRAAILLTHAAYTHSVATREEIKPRVKEWGLKIRKRVLGWFGLETGSTPDAQPDSRQQLQRKNEISPSASGSS